MAITMPEGPLSYLNEILHEALGREMIRKLALDEALIRRMLGEWVSGLEPSVLYGPGYVIIGLTIAGLPLGVVAPVVVRA